MWPQAKARMTFSLSADIFLGVGCGSYMIFTEAAAGTSGHVHETCLAAVDSIEVETLGYKVSIRSQAFCSTLHPCLASNQACTAADGLYSAVDALLESPEDLHERTYQSLALYSWSVPCPSCPYCEPPALHSLRSHSHMVNSAPHATAVQLLIFCTSTGALSSSAGHWHIRHCVRPSIPCEPHNCPKSCWSADS